MNLETCISVVAGYFYAMFLEKLEPKESIDNENNSDTKEELPYEEINEMRYTDWAISTPLMLLVLCIVLGMENKKKVYFSSFLLILLFNMLMLGSGYIGEMGKLTKTSANILGFVFFTLMYGTIWNIYMSGKRTINIPYCSIHINIPYCSIH